MIDIPLPSRSFDVQVDGQDAESWSAILAQFADATIYQSWAYGSVRWGVRHLSHLVLRREGEILAAAQLRIARLPILPAGLAYLRWGPLCQRKDRALDPIIVARMFACLREEYCQRRRLAFQIIPNAYPGDFRGAVFQEALAQSSLRPQLDAPSYRTVVVDLTPTVEALRKRLDQKWRNQLNRSEKNGLLVEVNHGQDAYRQFLALYQGMWTRKQFETSVDVDEFGRIQEALPVDQKMHTFLALKDGEAVAALVVSLLGTSGIYVLGATNERARDLKAAYFLHWQTMLWLKQHGACAYDLGGIDPDANPGGYHFKSGFGGSESVQIPTHAAMGGWLSRGVIAFSRFRRRPNPVPRAAPPTEAIPLSRSLHSD